MAQMCPECGASNFDERVTCAECGEALTREEYAVEIPVPWQPSAALVRVCAVLVFLTVGLPVIGNLWYQATKPQHIAMTSPYVGRSRLAYKVCRSDIIPLLRKPILHTFDTYDSLAYRTMREETRTGSRTYFFTGDVDAIDAKGEVVSVMFRCEVEEDQNGVMTVENREVTAR